MKLNVTCSYDGIHSLTHKQGECSYGIIELTEDEYFAFQKCEIEFMAWNEKIIDLIKAKAINKNA